MSDPADFLAELRWRGLLHQCAGDGIEQHLQRPGRVAYCGFDPTADSLTVGNFLAIKLLMSWQRCGHRPIVLMGGGTGLIGDPSGRDSERQLLSREAVEHNIARQRLIFERLLDFDPANPCAARLVNNHDWLAELGYIDVLRDIGKHFSVNAMIKKDSVAERLNNREQGISYTEFSYMLLQSYDFLHLHRAHGCTVQLAGSDQYGNIVGGMDLIRRHGGEAFGITNQLVTRSDGQKIGKSAGNAVWLSADRSSPWQFYQFWLNTADEDAVRFLRWFSFLPAAEIEALAADHATAPQRRGAQRALAAHLTGLLHGDGELRAVEKAAAALFSGEVRGLDRALLGDLVADLPDSEHPRAALDGEGVALTELLAETSLASSRRQAREFLHNGALAVNGERVDGERRLRCADLLHGQYILLRRGKKHWHATRWD